MQDKKVRVKKGDLLVSAIVPIYKVEKDLEACVKSIQNQSYKNLEIILVDDGSPDRCPVICEILKSCDKRISVIHKKNGGLSDARNAALEVCKGDYILFVDSDDLIHEDMIDTLLGLSLDYGSEITVCDYVSVPTKSFIYNRIKPQAKVDSVVEELTPDEALRYMMDVYKNFQVSACNKLYKASLFNKIRYPVGVYYEDIAITYKLIDKSTKVVYTHSEYYFYQLRANSITRSGFNKRDLDKIKNCTELVDFVKVKYPAIYQNAVVYKYVYCYMTIINKLLRSEDEGSRKLLGSLLKEIKENMADIKLKLIPIKKRILFFIMLYNLNIYSFVQSKR